MSVKSADLAVYPTHPVNSTFFILFHLHLFSSIRKWIAFSALSPNLVKSAVKRCSGKNVTKNCHIFTKRNNKLLRFCFKWCSVLAHKHVSTLFFFWKVEKAKDILLKMECLSAREWAKKITITFSRPTTHVFIWLEIERAPHAPCMPCRQYDLHSRSHLYYFVICKKKSLGGE